MKVLMRVTEDDLNFSRETLVAMLERIGADPKKVPTRHGIEFIEDVNGALRMVYREVIEAEDGLPAICDSCAQVVTRLRSVIL